MGMSKVKLIEWINVNKYPIIVLFGFLQFISKTLQKTMLKISLILALVLFLPSYSYLDVYIPECGRLIIPKNINYTLSNFGYIPYGESFVGQIFKPKVDNNTQLCNVQSQHQIKSDGAKAFMIVKRGTCKFTQKVLNAQKLGAQFVIIYDNETNDQPHVIMKNDGHGHLVTIPSAFISNADGQKILKALKQCSENLYLKEVFDVFESQVVDLSLWLNLNNRQSYVLLRDFYKYDYYNVIDEYVNTSVKFRVDYGCVGNFCEKEDCIGSKANNYCIPIDRQTSSNNEIASGSQLLKESLRMYTLFNLLPQNKDQIWFKYMIKFDQNLCLEVKDIQTCSYDTMRETGVANQLIEAIRNNVTLTLKQLQSTQSNRNNVFYWIVKQADEKNILFYPEAVINGKNFYGLFKAPQVFEMICNSLLAQPSQCYSFIKNKTSPQVLDKTDDLWLTVFFIILLMTLGFLVALFVYTKLIKKQVNQQMSMQVNKMVENYVSLTQQKSGSQQNAGTYNKVQM